MRGTTSLRWLSLLFGVAVGIAAGLLLWGSAAWFGDRLSGQGLVTPEVAPRGELTPGEQRTIELFERARGSVVYISTQRRVRDFWTRDVLEVPQGTGSGFVWDGEGHIVTNSHVLAGATAARVRLADGRDLPARLAGASRDHDLAVLRIDVDDGLPPPLPIGTSHDLSVGQQVLAIGNPFGLDWTLTTGVVSALDRSLRPDGGRFEIEGLVQTDAAINPGNSGGPLLDSAGRLIGVNTAIVSPSGAYSGVGFAVPVDTVIRVIPQLVAHGTYVRPALGVDVNDDANRILSQQTGLEGVFVLRAAPGSAAAAAGLRGVQVADDGSVTPGDVIVAVNGQAVDSVSRLLARLDDREAGEEVQLTIARDGEQIKVPVTLQAGR